MGSGHTNVASVGALAADLLVEACGAGSGLHPATVRGLAEDLGRGLRSSSGKSEPLVEAALACADLATLAACNAPALPDAGRATAAAHLAAGAARALVALAEAGIGAPEDVHAHNVLRDARSAGWKADLAVRQLSGAS